MQTNLTELKSFGSPPPAVSNVSAAVMVLIAPRGKVPKDRSWKAAKVTMAKVDGFLDSLVHFDSGGSKRPASRLERRAVWMWFGAFPGAFGLGRAQPQRRGTSP